MPINKGTLHLTDRQTDLSGWGHSKDPWMHHCKGNACDAPIESALDLLQEARSQEQSKAIKAKQLSK
jgi:hypothetical protein